MTAKTLENSHRTHVRPRERVICQNETKTAKNGLRDGWDDVDDFLETHLCDFPVISLYHMAFRHPPKIVRSMSRKFPELLGGGDAPRV